jgi:cysteinyl-tRNA synthetase, unknown class
MFQEFAKTVPDAEGRMVEFLTRLIAHARRLKPDILIVMQNAEELLKHSAVRTGIDALAKEDLYYGIDHTETRNPPDTIEWSAKELQQMKRSGRPVFVVEYLSDAAKAADAQRRADKHGFRLHVTARDLGQLTLDPPRAAVPAGAAPLAPGPRKG